MNINQRSEQSLFMMIGTPIDLTRNLGGLVNRLGFGAISLGTTLPSLVPNVGKFSLFADEPYLVEHLARVFALLFLSLLLGNAVIGLGMATAKEFRAYNPAKLLALKEKAGASNNWLIMSDLREAINQLELAAGMVGYFLIFCVFEILLNLIGLPSTLEGIVLLYGADPKIPFWTLMVFTSALWFVFVISIKFSACRRLEAISQILFKSGQER